MGTLKRQEYKKFIEQHVIRPYQSMISDSEKALNFTNDFYNSLPQLMEDNDEWATCVLNRIAFIYSSVDGDYFPQGRTQIALTSGLKAHGVNVIW